MYGIFLNLFNKSLYEMTTRVRSNKYQIWMSYSTTVCMHASLDTLSRLNNRINTVNDSGIISSHESKSATKWPFNDLTTRYTSTWLLVSLSTN